MNTQQMERAIIATIVESALEQGYGVRHNDGEENTVTVYPINMDSHYLAATGGVKNDTQEMVAKILAEIHAADEEYLIILDQANKKKIGSIYLVYGNDGHDVICDHTDNEIMTGIVQNANALADTYCLADNM